MSQASALEPEKKLDSLPSAQGPKKWKFGIPHHRDKSTKILQVALSKSV